MNDKSKDDFKEEIKNRMRNSEFEECLGEADSQNKIEKCARKTLPRSYRNYEHKLFQKAFKLCSDVLEDDDLVFACKGEVRKKYKEFEDNRWYEAMDRLHNMVSKLDPDEAFDFKSDYPETASLINEFAKIEELKRI